MDKRVINLTTTRRRDKRVIDLTTTRRRFMVGGCAYRDQVHVGHAVCIATLAAFSAAGDGELPLYTGGSYRHTSNLPQGRCMWIREMIASHAKAPDLLTHAMSMDSDTWCVAADMLAALAEMPDDAAMGIAPVRQGDTGAINLHKLRGDHLARMTPYDLKQCLEGDREIDAGGFGIVVFNLAWFAKFWPEPDIEHLTDMAWPSGMRTGEDIEFCHSVRKRGGRIVALPVKTHHYAYQQVES